MREVDSRIYKSEKLPEIIDGFVEMMEKQLAGKRDPSPAPTFPGRPKAKASKIPPRIEAMVSDLGDGTLAFTICGNGVLANFMKLSAPECFVLSGGRDQYLFSGPGREKCRGAFKKLSALFFRKYAGIMELAEKGKKGCRGRLYAVRRADA